VDGRDHGQPERSRRDPAHQVGVAEVRVHDVRRRRGQVPAHAAQVGGPQQAAHAHQPGLDAVGAQGGARRAPVALEQVAHRDLEATGGRSGGQVGQQRLGATPGQRGDEVMHAQRRGHSAGYSHAARDATRRD
jgi:hypothetical protein